jgi:hypothetical protein
MAVGAVGDSTGARARFQSHFAKRRAVANSDGTSRQRPECERAEHQFAQSVFCATVNCQEWQLLHAVRRSARHQCEDVAPGQSAGRVRTDINLTDNLNIKAGVNAPDLSGLGALFKVGVDIPDFNFELNGETVTLTGNAPSDEVEAGVEAAAKAAWPNIKIISNIQVSQAPAPGTGPCASLQADISGLLSTPIDFQTDGFSLRV